MLTTTLPTGDHQISLSAAVEMTARYRANRATILNSTYSSTDVLPLSETFNKAALEPFFNNTDCAGIRIYYGMNAGLEVHAIIVGVNEDNEDMLPTGSLTNEEDLILLEDSQRCPPSCPPASPLNEDEE